MPYVEVFALDDSGVDKNIGKIILRDGEFSCDPADSNTLKNILNMSVCAPKPDGEWGKFTTQDGELFLDGLGFQYDSAYLRCGPKIDDPKPQEEQPVAEGGEVGSVSELNIADNDVGHDRLTVPTQLAKEEQRAEQADNLVKEAVEQVEFQHLEQRERLQEEFEIQIESMQNKFNQSLFEVREEIKNKDRYIGLLEEKIEKLAKIEPPKEAPKKPVLEAPPEKKTDGVDKKLLNAVLKAIDQQNKKSDKIIELLSRKEPAKAKSYTIKRDAKTGEIIAITSGEEEPEEEDKMDLLSGKMMHEE